MKNFMRLFLWGTLTLTAASASAGTVSSVGSAGVDKGKTKVEVRVGFADADEDSSQDQRLRLRQQIDYGVTDWYAARLVLQQDDRKGNNTEHASIRLSNRFQILDKDESGFDLGARIEYTHVDGDKTPSDLTLGGYQLIPLDDYEIRLNQLFSHDVGEDADDGVGMELRFQLTRKINDKLRIGVDSFNDFGNLTELSGYSDQEHEIGPVVKGKLGNAYGYLASYRTGISEAAANHNFSFFLSKSF